MKWQQRVRVATGLDLLADYVAFTGSGDAGNRLDERHVVRVGTELCVLYGVTVLLMLWRYARHHEQRFGAMWRMCWKGDYHTVLRHRADCPLAAIRVLQNNVFAGAGEAGYRRARRGLLAKILKLHHFASKSYAAEPVVAAIASSDTAFTGQFPDSHP